MLNDFISRFNWVDIFVLIIIFRIGYVAMITGIRTEVFNFCGVICAIYLSSHYYTALSDFFAQLVPGNIIPLKFLDFLKLNIFVDHGLPYFCPGAQHLPHFRQAGFALHHKQVDGLSFRDIPRLPDQRDRDLYHGDMRGHIF